MKKKLYIHGSFMNDNYGDFLLYYVIEKTVEQYEDRIDWYSADVDVSYDNYCKVNRRSKKEAILNSDIVIFAGGGYFGEPNKRRILWNLRCLIKHLIPAFIIAKRKIPYALIGVETGPLLFSVNRKILKYICNNAKIISVRNAESEVFLKKIGVHTKIEINPDWIMGIDKKILPNETAISNEYISKEMNNILVHLTTKNNNDGMKNVIFDLLKYQKENENTKYIIICDQNRQSQKDRANVLLEYLNNNKNMIAYYNGPWVLSSLISKCDAVITDKLHVGIVATKYNKEVISVASHQKSIKFYNLIGREKWTNLLYKIKPFETYEKLNKLTFKDISIDKKVFLEAGNNKALCEKFIDSFLKGIEE